MTIHELGASLSETYAKYLNGRHLLKDCDDDRAVIVYDTSDGLSWEAIGLRNKLGKNTIGYPESAFPDISSIVREDPIDPCFITYEVVGGYADPYLTYSIEFDGRIDEIPREFYNAVGKAFLQHGFARGFTDNVLEIQVQVYSWVNNERHNTFKEILYCRVKDGFDPFKPDEIYEVHTQDEWFDIREREARDDK